MTAHLAHIWRHPIKAHGAEPLDAVEVTPHQGLPLDRAWAVAHDAAKEPLDGRWVHCRNFTRGASAPELMAIDAVWDAARRQLLLRHPSRPDLSFDPDVDGNAFIEWVRPLMPEGRAMPARIVRAQQHTMTDADFPSISLMNLSSLRAVSDKAGRKLDQRRWRGNLWIEGLGPWQEFEWIGKQISIAGVRFEVVERITRCKSTMANPDTGKRDTDTLGILEEGWGHTDFGVNLRAIDGGALRIGDPVELP